MPMQRLRRGQRQKERHGLAGKGDQAVVPVKRSGGCVLGIDHQGIRGNFRAQGTRQGIGQQGAAQTLALERLVNGQAAHAHGGHRRVAGKLFAQVGGQLGQQQGGGGQGVKPGDAPVLADHHIAGGHAAPDILRDLLGKVAVQQLGAAIEHGAVMPAVQQDHLEQWCHCGAQEPAPALKGALQSFCRPWREQPRLRKALLVGADQKVRHGAPSELGGPLERGLQLEIDPGL